MRGVQQFPVAEFVVNGAFQGFWVLPGVLLIKEGGSTSFASSPPHVHRVWAMEVGALPSVSSLFSFQIAQCIFGEMK